MRNKLALTIALSSFAAAIALGVGLAGAERGRERAGEERVLEQRLGEVANCLLATLAKPFRLRFLVHGWRSLPGFVEGRLTRLK